MQAQESLLQVVTDPGRNLIIVRAGYGPQMQALFAEGTRFPNVLPIAPYGTAALAKVSALTRAGLQMKLTYNE